MNTKSELVFIRKKKRKTDLLKKKIKEFKKLYSLKDYRISDKTFQEYKYIVQPKIDDQGFVEHTILNKKTDRDIEYNLSYGNFGKKKYRKYSLIDKNIQPYLEGNIGTQYGQDRAFSSEKSIGICDGHGLRGEISTMHVTKFLVKNKLNLVSDQITELLFDNKIKEAEKIVRKCFIEANNYFKKNYSYQNGGTTFSIIMPFHKNGRRFLGGFNLGDSESYVINKGKIIMLSSNHNWENLDEYQIYVNWCIKNNKKIMPAVYGRFCCGAGDIPDINGQIKPHKIFDINDGRVIMNKKNYNHLYQKLLTISGTTKEYIIGGYQSIRKETIEKYNHDNNEWELFKPMPNTESQNWGSSVLIGKDGGSQLTRSFMDWKEEEDANTMSDGIFPHIQFLELEENDDAISISHSDGFGDAIYLHEVKNQIYEMIKKNNKIEAKNIAENLYNFLIKKSSGYGYEYTIHNNLPKWDDISISVMRWFNPLCI